MGIPNYWEFPNREFKFGNSQKIIGNGNLRIIGNWEFSKIGNLGKSKFPFFENSQFPIIPKFPIPNKNSLLGIPKIGNWEFGENWELGIFGNREFGKIKIPNF